MSGIPHDHSVYVPCCFRCELSRDEVEEPCETCGGTRKRNGCPATVWDGPYRMRCSLGGAGDICARHGKFDKEPCPDCSPCETEKK